MFFYHLTRSGLEATLPGLLERTLARGWRAVVRTGLPERVAALDSLLWSYAEESFLPHGSAATGFPERQPVWITAGREIPNRAEVLFLVDGAGAETGEMAALVRTVLLFDGRDADAVAAARADWRRATQAGLAATYWAEEDGRWVRRAEAGGAPG